MVAGRRPPFTNQQEPLFAVRERDDTVRASNLAQRQGLRQLQNRSEIAQVRVQISPVGIKTRRVVVSNVLSRYL